MEYNSKKQVPDKYKINLKDYFEDEKAWEAKLIKVKEDIKKFTIYNNKKLNSKEIETFLNLYFEINSDLADLYIYSSVNHDLDLQNKLYLEMLNKLQLIETDFEQKTAFFEPMIINFSQKEFADLFKENKNLENYRVILENIYEMKDHVLTPKEEQLISLLTQTYSSYEIISSTLINSEHNYGKVQIAEKKIPILINNLEVLKQNKQEKIRKKVSTNFAKVIKQYENTESSLLNYYIENNVNIAKIRNYRSAWDEKLKRIHISNEVFENLKNCAKDNKKSWQEYFKLMKKVLKLDVLHGYDTALNWSDENKSYSIEQAQSIILKALEILGEDYVNKVKKVFDCNYIDYCPYKGKLSGGYSICGYHNPSRIVLSYNNNYNGILTIAHEVGHNINYQYINENNLLWYRGNSSFVAEVASLTNEFLVNHYVAVNSQDKQERMQGIENTLKTFQNNFFDAIMEAQMEQDMYEHKEKGEVISANYLNNLVKKYKNFYLGNVIKNNKYSYHSWVTRSHYYMFFYLYSYALCVSVAAIVSKKIINQEDNMLKKYKEFLKCGSNLKPEEAYKVLGVDLKDKNVLDEAISFFDEQIELYKKIREEVNHE